MRKMKDSGIEWIGEIPEDWEIHPLYSYFVERKNKNTSLKEQNLLSLSYGNIIRKDINSNGGLLPANFSTYNIVEAGDIIIRPTDLQNDKKSLRTGLVTERGIITSAYIDLQPKETVNSKYFHYLLHSYDMMKVFYNMGSGVRQGLNYSVFAKIHVFAPPYHEQQRIADFLDTKCAEIETLAADIQKEIDVLKEYKKSIITEAVTKGLDPHVPMKDSGIEWIGKIPQDWGVNRVKYLFMSSKGLSITKENLIEEGLPVISYGQIHSKTNTGTDIPEDLLRYVSYDYRKFSLSKIEKFDFAFADTSEDYDGCGNCVYKRTDDELYGGYHVVILKSRLKQDNRYFAYLFQTDAWRKQIRTRASGIKVFSITQKILNEASVIIPAIDEQQRIADYLDTKCEEIDKIIKQKHEQLSVLEEYKKSLIYEYVTGKKEVMTS